MNDPKNSGNQDLRPENTPGEHPAGSLPPDRQMIPEGGEKYLREIANIEDTPGPDQERQAEEVEKETSARSNTNDKN